MTDGFRNSNNDQSEESNSDNDQQTEDQKPSKSSEAVNKNIYVEIGNNIKLEYDIPKLCQPYLGFKGKLTLVNSEKVKLEFGTWFKFDVSHTHPLNCILNPNSNYNNKKIMRPGFSEEVKAILSAGTIVNFGLGPHTLSEDLLVYLPHNAGVQIQPGTICQMFFAGISDGFPMLEFKEQCNVYLYSNPI